MTRQFWLGVAAALGLITIAAGGPVVNSIVATTCSASNWVRVIAGTGAATCSQPASTDLSDVTAATTWVPTDNSAGSLTFTSVTANFSKGNKTCVGNFRLTFPSTVNGAGISITLPCTVANNGSPGIGTCWSTSATPAIGFFSAVGVANTATFTGVTSTSAASVTNANLSLLTLSCSFSFITT